VIGSAEIQFNFGSGTSITMRAQSIDAAYDPSTVNYANQPAHGALQSISKTFSTTGYKSFDVTDIVKAVQAGSAYGVELVATAGSGYMGTGYGGNAEPPMLVINYASEGAAGYVATPLTGSGEMIDPAFSNVTNASANAPALTGSGLALDPTVTLVSNIGIVAEAMTGSGEMFVGSGFAVPAVVNGTPALGSGESVDAAVSTQRNAVVLVGPATGSGGLSAPIEAQNASDDPYYNEIFATTDSDDFWYRLDESAGSVIHDARGTTAQDADLVGDYSFGVFGPVSRKAIHMENGYAQRRTNYLDDSDTDTFAFEVVLRTTQKDGMLAYGLDRANPEVITGPIPTFRNAIYLKNGRVSTNWKADGRTDTDFELSGVKNIADGQWHHVVVAFNYGDANNLNSGLRIYIDGKLDIRRRRDVVPGLWASPDSYFGMPEAWRNVTQLYPWQQNFNGDVMEVVFRYKDELTQDQSIELYYDAMGIVPIRVEPAVGFGVMPEAVGKGNQKRALVLYTRWYGAGNTSGNLIGDERNAPSGYSTTIPDEFDHDIQIGRVYEPGENPWTDLAGYRVSAVTIMREDSNPTGPYRDPITDLPRLLNLQEDLNLDNYDLILFRNWPDEGADQEVFRQRGYDNQAINDFLASVKQAVVDGKSLEITNVGLASRLGLISSAQAIPMLVDRTTDGESDVRASMLNPWDNEKVGSTYLDLHANNWHRVAANISNLTDIEDAQFISEAYLTYNFGLDFDVNNKWGYKLTDEPLQIGDELIDTMQFLNRIASYVNVAPVTRIPWDRYQWAVTPDGLLAGTAVYKFANKMWQGNTQVDNPYKDFIGGAVVQPGDAWGGVRIAGKVFMNFAEYPFEAAQYGSLARQVVPANELITNPLDREDATKREWDYSFNRIAFSGVGGSTSADELVLQEQPDGSYKYSISKGGSVVGINIVEKYPTEQVVVPTWALRGLAWLAVTESIPAGSVVIRPTPAEATSALASPVTVAERSVEVTAQVALGLGVLVAPDEVEEPDAVIYVFPLEGSGAMTGYGKTITVAPMEGSGELVDNFELISAKGEQVVLYLHGLSEVELFMEGK
jgi:hypothetical protein